MPEFDAPSADVRLPSPAEEQAADALRARLRAAFPPGRAYTLADLNTPAMPAAVGRFIVQALQRRLVMEREALREARSDWFDHDAPAVEAAWDDLVDALGAHARVPADEWPRALDQAAAQVAAFLLRPAPTLAAFVFADGAPNLPVGVILRRMSYFTSYPYLRDVVAAYVEQRGLDRLDRATFASLLERVERRTPSAYRGQWTTLFADLYATLGTGTPATLPAALLAPTLADRGLTALAQQLATYDGALTLDDLARIVDADPAGTRSGPTPRTTPPAPAPAPVAAIDDASPENRPVDAPEPAGPPTPAASTPDLDAPRAVDGEPSSATADDAWTPAPPNDATTDAAPTSPPEADGMSATEPAYDAHAEDEAADAAWEADRDEADQDAETPDVDETPAENVWDAPPADDTAVPEDSSWRPGESGVPDAAPNAHADTDLDADTNPDAIAPGHTFDWGSLPEEPTATDPDAALAHDIPEPDPAPATADAPFAPRAAASSPPWDEAPATAGGFAPRASPTEAAMPTAPAPGPVAPASPAFPAVSSPEPTRPVSLADRPVASLDPLPPVASRTPGADAPDDDERPLWQRVLRREASPAPPSGRPDDLDTLEARTLGAGARTRRDSFVSGLFGGDAAAYAAALGQLDAVSSWPDAAGVLLGLFRTRGVDLYDPTAVAFTDAAEQRYL